MAWAGARVEPLLILLVLFGVPSGTAALTRTSDYALSKSELLLPPSAPGRRVETRVEAEGAGCFQWSASDGLEVRQEDDCGKSALVAAVSWGGYRWQGELVAKPLSDPGKSSKASIKSTVFVDAPNSISLAHATSQLPVGHRARVTLRGYSAGNDEFDTMEGLRVEWDADEPILAKISSEGESLLLEGRQPGRASVAATVTDARFGELRAKMAFTVALRMQIEPGPAPIVLLPRARLQLTLRAPNGTAISHDSLEWHSWDTSVGDVSSRGEVKSFCVGETRIEAFLRSSHGEAIASTRVQVAQASRLALAAQLPSSEEAGEGSNFPWPLRKRSSYLAIARAEANDGRRIRFTSLEDARISLVRGHGSVSLQESSFHSDGERISAGMTALEESTGGELVAWLPPSQHHQSSNSDQSCSRNSARVSQPFQVCRGLLALPDIHKDGTNERALHLPVADRSEALDASYPLRADGGCSLGHSPRWHADDPSIGEIVANARVKPNKRGQTMISVEPSTDLGRLHLGDSLRFLASPPEADGRESFHHSGIDVFPGSKALLEAIFAGSPVQGGSPKRYTQCTQLARAVHWRPLWNGSGGIDTREEPVSEGACAAARVTLPSGAKRAHVAAELRLDKDARPLRLQWEVAVVEPLRVRVDNCPEQLLAACEGSENADEPIRTSVGSILEVSLSGGPAVSGAFPPAVFTHDSSGPVTVRERWHKQHAHSRDDHSSHQRRTYDVECVAEGAAMIRFMAKREGHSEPASLGEDVMRVECDEAASVEIMARAHFPDGSVGYWRSHWLGVPWRSTASVVAHTLAESGKPLVAPPATSRLSVTAEGGVGMGQADGALAWPSRPAWLNGRKGSVTAMATLKEGHSQAEGRIDLEPVDTLRLNANCSPLRMMASYEAAENVLAVGGTGEIAVARPGPSASPVSASATNGGRAVKISPESAGEDEVVVVDNGNGQKAHCKVSVAEVDRISAWVHPDPALVRASAELFAVPLSQSGSALRAGPMQRALRARVEVFDEENVGSVVEEGRTEEAVEDAGGTGVPAVPFKLRPMEPGTHMLRVHSHALSWSGTQPKSAMVHLRAHERPLPGIDRLSTVEGALHTVELKARPMEALDRYTLLSSHPEVVEIAASPEWWPPEVLAVRARKQGNATLSVIDKGSDSPFDGSVATVSVEVSKLAGVLISVPSELEFGRRMPAHIAALPSKIDPAGLSSACSYFAWRAEGGVRIISESSSLPAVEIEAVGKDWGRLTAKTICQGAEWEASAPISVLPGARRHAGEAEPVLLLPARFQPEKLHWVRAEAGHVILSSEHVEPALEASSPTRDIAPKKGVEQGWSCLVNAPASARRLDVCARVSTPMFVSLSPNKPNHSDGSSFASFTARSVHTLKAEAMDVNGIPFSRAVPTNLLSVRSNNTAVAKVWQSDEAGFVHLRAVASGTAAIIVELEGMERVRSLFIAQCSHASMSSATPATKKRESPAVQDRKQTGSPPSPPPSVPPVSATSGKGDQPMALQLTLSGPNEAPAQEVSPGSTYTFPILAHRGKSSVSIADERVSLTCGVSPPRIGSISAAKKRSACVLRTSGATSGEEEAVTVWAHAERAGEEAVARRNVSFTPSIRLVEPKSGVLQLPGRVRLQGNAAMASWRMEPPGCDVHVHEVSPGVMELSGFGPCDVVFSTKGGNDVRVKAEGRHQGAGRRAAGSGVAGSGPPGGNVLPRWEPSPMAVSWTGALAFAAVCSCAAAVHVWLWASAGGSREDFPLLPLCSYLVALLAALIAAAIFPTPS